MDDTPGNLQLHLKSDHQSSELNLGHITRIPDSSGRKDFRGEGFELRTDGHGVVRAAKGLIISTYARIKADNYIKDIKEVTTRLKNAVDLHKMQIQSALAHKADLRAESELAGDELKQQLEHIEGDKTQKQA